MSRFYQLDEIPSLKILAGKSNKFQESNSGDKLFSNNDHLLIDIFNFNHGKIPYIERLLCWFPEFMHKHFETEMNLMFTSGPLPLDWRYFIGIIV